MKYMVLGWFALGIVLWGSAWQLLPIAVFLAFVWTYITIPFTTLGLVVLFIRWLWKPKS